MSFRALGRKTQQHVARFQKLSWLCRVNGLKEGGKAVGIAKFRDGAAVLAEPRSLSLMRPSEVRSTRSDGWAEFSLPLRSSQSLQLDEHHAHILALTGKGETTNREDRLDVLCFSIHVVVFHLAQNRLGILRVNRAVSG